MKMPGIVPLLVGLSLCVLSHGQSKCDGCGYAPRHPRINTSRQSTCGGGGGEGGRGRERGKWSGKRWPRWGEEGNGGNGPRGEIE